MEMIEQIGIYYLLAINVIAFVMYGFDKWMAAANTWRVSEKMLWFVALIGGSAGALFGMKTFRHKTRKTSFQLVLFGILLVQAIVVGAYAYFTGLITV